VGRVISARALRRLPFRGSLAVAAGQVTAKQLRGPHYQRLFPDVYIRSEIVLDHRMWSLAALVYAGPTAAASGLSAAYCWGVDLLPLEGAPPEVTVPRQRHLAIAKSRLVVVRSDLKRDEISRNGAMRLTSPKRTAFDLARRLPRVEAVVAVDAMLSRRLVSLPELTQCLALAGGRHGVARAKAALELAEPSSESPMETRARLAIVDGGLPRPTAQYEVRTISGLFVARLDLAYEEWKIGIEYEGDHHRERSTFRRDIERGNLLSDLGWSILRVTADDVLRRPAEMVRRIQKLISAASQGQNLR
jgi:hypothetical protein